MSNKYLQNTKFAKAKRYGSSNIKEDMNLDSDAFFKKHWAVITGIFGSVVAVTFYKFGK